MKNTTCKITLLLASCCLLLAGSAEAATKRGVTVRVAFEKGTRTLVGARDTQARANISKLVKSTLEAHLANAGAKGSLAATISCGAYAPRVAGHTYVLRADVNTNTLPAIAVDLKHTTATGNYSVGEVRVLGRVNNKTEWIPSVLPSAKPNTL